MASQPPPTLLLFPLLLSASSPFPVAGFLEIFSMKLTKLIGFGNKHPLIDMTLADENTLGKKPSSVLKLNILSQHFPNIFYHLIVNLFEKLNVHSHLQGCEQESF